MQKFKWLTLLNGLLWINVSLASAAPIFSIVPSIASLTMRSDGGSSVIYTVTNNANVAINGLFIDPAYHTTGNPNGLTLQNNICNTTLAAHSSCQFGVVINHQNANFTITPRVCDQTQSVCSTTSSANTLAATVLAITEPAYAYFSITPMRRGFIPTDSLQPLNTETYALGTGIYNLSLSSGEGNPASLAVSLDGTRVYAVNATISANTSGHSIVVIEGGEHSQTIQTIALDANANVPATNFFIGLTPDDKKLYVSDNQSDAVYVVDLTLSQVNMVSGIFSAPYGIAVSPDGSRAFIANGTGGEGTGNISVINTATDATIATIGSETATFDQPTRLLVSPDGTRLYVKNANDIVVLGINGDSYTQLDTIAGLTESSDMALSYDGNTLYVSSLSDKIYKIDTQTFTSEPLSMTSNSNTGIALTPDNSKLFIQDLMDDQAAVLTPLSDNPILTLINDTNGSTTQCGAFVN